MPDWVSLEGVTTNVDQWLHNVAARVAIPPGHTFQAMGAGNFGISEMIGGVLKTFVKVGNRSALNGGGVIVKTGTSTTGALDHSSFPALSARYTESPFQAKVYWFDGLSRVVSFDKVAKTLATIQRVDIGPVVEFKNISNSTQFLWIGSFDECVSGGATLLSHADSISLKLALTSFLDSW